ncbi:MAG: acetyltransferase [Lachnospiraceae bacterium]|nr:acetyltransferase [Lachnospiraceae bacterium]
MGRLFIVGCSGHGKVIADIALKQNKYDELLFLDDNPKSDSCLGIPVVGSSTYENITSEDEIIVAIGNSDIRQRLQEMYSQKGLKIATLIHPDAVIGTGVKIDVGTVVMAGAVINPDAVIGKGVIINTGATVDHDDVICDYVHISVGAHIAGTVTIGRRTWVGIGASVSNNLSICKDCIIGAGAVVVKSIKNSGNYVGVPAARLASRVKK